MHFAGRFGNMPNNNHIRIKRMHRRDVRSLTSLNGSCSYIYNGVFIIRVNGFFPPYFVSHNRPCKGGFRMGLWDKLGLVTKCDSCNETQHLLRCPYCDGTVCENCLNIFVGRKSWPEWFIGRKVKKKAQFENTIHEYSSKQKSKGRSIHLCNHYIDKRWANIQLHLKHVEERSGKKDPVYDFRTK